MPNHIIDKKLPEFADVPDNLEGEVLLERTLDNQGRLSGWLTAPVGVVRSMRH
jgi:hypothetical protein